MFSHLISNGKITNVFTTNFDDLIYDSLIRYTETKPKIYSHNEVAQYINTLSKRPNIIKLHGDFLFENIKNTKPETGLLWSNMESKLEECLKSFDLVVVGYNGADDSVMNALAKLKTKDYGLLWCGRNPENLNWRVKELINQTNNSYFIQIESFELLSMKLFEVYKDEIDYPDFRSNAERKEKEVTQEPQNPTYAPASGKAKGGTIDFLFHQNPIARAGGAQYDVDENNNDQLVWGEALKANLKQTFTRYKTLRFEVFNDWLPTDDCFVSLDETVTDKWGSSVAKVRIGAHAHDLLVGEYLAKK